MAKKTYEIDVKFTARDRMSRMLARMGRSVARVTRSMERRFRQVDKVTSRMVMGLGKGVKRGAIAAGAAVTGLALAIGKLVDNMDDLAKQSARLDFPIEALQEYEFAATQSGVAGDVFRRGIDKFSRSFGELKGGFGALETGLKKMDPNLRKQLKTAKNTEEAFGMYLTAMREMPDAAKRAALGSMAFGRVGIKMVNMATLTADQLAELRKEMRENGVMTAAQAAEAEKYNDALSSLQLAGTGLLRGFLEPLLPQLTKGARLFREWIVNNREMVKSRVLEWGQKVVDNWRNIVDWAKKIGKGVVVFFALVGVLKVLIGILTVVNALMAANPIGLIVIGVVAMVAAITAAYVWADKLKKVFDDLPMPVKALFAVLLPIMGPLAWLITAAVAIKTKWGSLTAFLTDAFARIKSAVHTATEAIKNGAVSVINKWIGVKNFFIDLWNGIKSAFEAAVNFLMTTGPISNLLAAVALIKREWGTIVEFFDSVWTPIVETVAAAVRRVIGFLMPLYFIVKDVWSRAMGAADDAVEGAVKSGAFKMILDAIDAVKNAFTALKPIIASIWAGIVAAIKKGADQIVEFISPVTNLYKKFQAAKTKLIGEQIGFVETEATERDETRAERGGGFIPQLVTPSERVSRSIEESRTTNQSEITIRDDTGRAEFTGGDTEGMTLIPTGAF